jgi:hypothetical protein
MRLNRRLTGLVFRIILKHFNSAGTIDTVPIILAQELAQYLSVIPHHCIPRIHTPISLSPDMAIYIGTFVHCSYKCTPHMYVLNPQVSFEAIYQMQDAF